MQRRTALRRMGALSVGLGLGGLLHGRLPGAFGAPESLAPVVPEALRAQSVLEVFLCGGVSQYESIYCVPDHGRDTRTHFHLYADTADFSAQLEACGFAGSALTEPFAEDGLGQAVHFGPFALPLRQRPDVLNRTRVSIVRHDLAPHEAAIPLALSGRPLGNPGLCGLGAHVQRFFVERDGDLGGPVAYALLSTSLVGAPIDNLRAVVSTGLHPAQARPLGLKVDAVGDLSALLGRPGVGSTRAEYDALLDHYHGQYSNQLRWKGQGEPLRARPFSEFAAGTSWLKNVDGIREVLDPTAFPAASATNCGESAPVDAVTMQYRAAAHLLNHPVRPARYVCVVDGGLVPPGNGGGGYDSHSDNTRIQARNLTHTLKSLLALVKQPGEVAEGKIDLDRTLIILNTEFGRSPSAEGGSGRNHWPYGYPIALIGGPVRARGVSGAIGPDGVAAQSSTPQESRMAALLALGISPFAPEAFNVADVPGTANEEQAALSVLATHFGIT